MSESDEEVIAESNRIIKRLENQCSGNLHLLQEKKRTIVELEATIKEQAAKIDRLTSRGIEDMKFEIEQLKSENKWMAIELTERRKQISVVRQMFQCGADNDGDCLINECPQRIERLSGCPLHDWDHDEEGISILRPIATIHDKGKT